MENLRCLNCKNYFGDLTCQAFTEKIPVNILDDRDDHSKPLPDQENDIVFEPIDK